MKRLLKLKWMACLLVLCIGCGATASVLAQDLPRFEENTLYVKFKDNSEISAKKMLNGKGDARFVQTSMLGLSNQLMNRFKIEATAISMSLFDNPVLDKTFMISIDPEAKAGIEQLMEELENNPDVEYVERVPFNRIFSADGERPVNDPYYGLISDPNKTINVSWHLDLINAQKAWEIQNGDPEVLVAVVDNAIWGEHEDLQIPSHRQYNCKDQLPGSSAPPVGKDVQDASCTSMDMYNSKCIAYEFSHGTHCAGAIAAINDNEKGIASIGGGVSLLAVGGPSLQYPSGIMNSYHGVEWAIDHGAKIISCSWGSDEYARTNEAVMKLCYEKGIIVIAAVGNNGTNTPHYPAAYTPYVISVGSIDADRKKSSFSNYGYWVDILSPGGNDTTTAYQTQIFSTTFCQNQYTRLFAGMDNFVGTYYDEMSGTSMATPILAGVVALMVSKDPTLTTDQVRAILQNTGSPVILSSQNYFNEYCHIVDAYAALNFLTTSPTYAPSIAKSTISTKTEHDSVWLEWMAPETTETITGYNIYRNGQKIVENHPGTSFLNVGLPLKGTFRYAIEPIYENPALYTLRTEIDVTLKEYFTIAALIRPDDSYGYVDGTGQFEKRQLYTLKAHANPGYHFEYWTDERGSKLFGATMSGPAVQNRRFFAYFGEGEISNENLKQLEKAVRISPNPAKDAINIQCEDYELQNVRISDMQGRIVYNAGCLDCDTHSLDIAIGSWAKGTYAVQVTTNKGIVSHKLIKR